MMRRLKLCVKVIAMTPLLSGCFGETTPDTQEFFESRIDEQTKENTILAQVKCEIKQGVMRSIAHPTEEGFGYGADWLKTWVAKINLKITVDEKGGLSPGFTYSTIPRMFSLSLGVNSQSEATRTETIGVTWAIKDILSSPIKPPCTHVANVQIQSNLKIDDFIENKVFLSRAPGNITYSLLGTPFDVFNYEATFIVTYGGGLTPSWTFTRFTVDQGTTLISASRARTDDLTITLGPSAKDNAGVARLDQEADDVHLASLIGQAVARSIRATQP